MNNPKWTIKSILQVASDYLGERGIESPRLSAEILLSHQLGLDRINLYLNFDRPLLQREVDGYRELIKRRAKREPIQYITGVQEFWSLEFNVDRRVLIPRPDTEILVEEALKNIKIEVTGEEPIILDLATGSGVIAVALSKELPHATIYATDISGPALEVARHNAHRHGVSDRIIFLEGNMWNPVREKISFFDLIVSNPPYIPEEDYHSLQPEVLLWEPKTALSGGRHGMEYIERIIQEAYRYLKPGAPLLIEMAPFQTQQAIEQMKTLSCYTDIYRKKDYTGQYRIVGCKRAKG